MSIGLYTKQPGVMLKLGTFSFSVSTAAYQSLKRSAEYKWASQERFGKAPVYQAISPGEQTISLSGVIYPEYRGGFSQVPTLRALAGTMSPHVMVSGSGESLGRWVITKVEETGGTFADAGRARIIEFSLELVYVGPVEAVQALSGVTGVSVEAISTGTGDIASQAKGLAQTVNSACQSVAGSLSAAKSQIEAAIGPAVSAGEEALGAVQACTSVVDKTLYDANKLLEMVGLKPIPVKVLNQVSAITDAASGNLQKVTAAQAILGRIASGLSSSGTATVEASNAVAKAQTAASSSASMLRGLMSAGKEVE